MTRASMLRLIRRRARRCANRLDAFSRSIGLECFRRGWHDGAPTRIGGNLCRDCGRASADLEESGTLRHTGGHVSPTRRVYSREHNTITQTSAWAPTRRGW